MSLDRQFQEWQEITNLSRLLRYEYTEPSDEKTKMIDWFAILYKKYVHEYGYYDPIEPPKIK